MLGSLEKLLERGLILGWSPEEPRRQSQYGEGLGGKDSPQVAPQTGTGPEEQGCQGWVSKGFKPRPPQAHPIPSPC